MPIPAGTVLTPAWHEDQGPEADRDHGSQNMLAAMAMAMPGAIGIAVSRLPASRRRIRQTAGMANASRRQRKALLGDTQSIPAASNRMSPLPIAGSVVDDSHAARPKRQSSGEGTRGLVAVDTRGGRIDKT